MRRLLPVLPLLLTLALASAPARAQDPLALPADDAFYVSPAAQQLKDLKPGDVIKSRPVTDINGAGITFDARAWQLMYRSTGSHGEPIAAVTTVIVPNKAYAGGRRPLVSYQMAIDSLGTQCTPSYTMRTGTQKEMISVGPLLELGWAVVVPDFEGLGMAYTAGVLSGQTTLDSLRAAFAFKDDGLTPAANPVGLWGYSGGGQATAWTAELAPKYAPELKIAGVAAGGVPPDIEAVARNIDGGPFFGIYAAGAFGLYREYPEMGIDAILNDAGRALKDRISTQCAEQLVGGYPFQSMSQYVTVPDPLSLPQNQKVLQANMLGKAAPTAPVFMYHSIADELIPVAGPDKLATEWCTQGASLFYQRDVLGEHVSYAFTGAPAAIAYLTARFNDVPAPSNCDIPRPARAPAHRAAALRPAGR